MTDVMTDFLWDVLQGGYIFIEVDDSIKAGLEGSIEVLYTNPEDREDGIFITDVLQLQEMGPKVKLRRYRPLVDQPALFRIFADTETTPDAVLKFTNKYGRLGKGVESEISTFRHRQGSIALTGEYFSAWIKEMTLMRETIARWDTVLGDKDLKTCWRLAKQSKTPELFFSRFGSIGSSSSGSWLDGIFGNLPIKPDKASVAALENVAGVLSSRLRLLTSIDVVFQPSYPPVAVCVIPESLLGAMWLQFALAVNNGFNYARCRECGKWFKSEPESGRVTKQYCSGACRSKSYRSRMDQAYSLSVHGTSIEDIAKELDTDPATIHRWLERMRML